MTDVRKYLNLGCGSRFHPDWINVDNFSSDHCIQPYDLRKGIPFQENAFDVVYHSHLLEHFPKDEALSFMKECYRVLKPGGIIRVAVPDLEQIVCIYLQVLDKALQGRHEWQRPYEWMMLELYDQTVRENPGGEMIEFFKQSPIPDEKFVYERVGSEGQGIIETLQNNFKPQKIKRGFIINQIFRVRLIPNYILAWFIKKLLGKDDYKALQIGRFRLQGEVHRWMYDRYSLTRLLKMAGFQNPIQRTAFESAIERWINFNLDTEPDGTIYKPSSLYMEAIKLN